MHDALQIEFACEYLFIECWKTWQIDLPELQFSHL